MSTNQPDLTGLDSAIAIVGLAGRFPGARNVEDFWENLCAGRESIRPLTEAELRAAGVPAELAARPDYVRAGAMIEDVEMFDADFFGFSPKEARITDPQHRIFLECAWEALEDAGHMPADYSGRIGVYAGAGFNTYMLHNLLPAGRELADTVGMLPLVIGNKADFMVTQTSYALGLTGPSVSINSACSTSLVATHFGVQSLLNYECDMALVGGVTVQVPQASGYLYQADGVFSPDGHCRPFDAAGEGTVPGNGAGVAVLKRLEDALADGDHIYALIRATAINNDGRRKAGFTAPSVQGQREVIAGAMALGDVPLDTIGYIEAHGTATSLGDPLELRALAEAYPAAGLGEGSCAIGSVKSNIGHLDAAAGIASLIKTALCLKNRKLVPSINFAEKNANCDFGGTPFRVNTSLREWDPNAEGMPLRAGVSSFGIGGTNAHAILEQWVEEEPEVAAAGRWSILPVSARSAQSLHASVHRLERHLARHPGKSALAVGHTLQVGRTAFPHRRAFLCPSESSPAEVLAGTAATNMVSGVAGAAPLPAVFMFPGVGDQYPGMAADLYRQEPAFAASFDACADALAAEGGVDLHRIVNASARVTPSAKHPGEPRLADPFAALRTRDKAAPQPGELDLAKASVAHPAIFAIEYALAKLLISWGVRPAAVIGHSLGEYAAACIAGVMSLEDAIRAVTGRAALIEELPGGAMVAVAMPAAELLEQLPPGASLAAVNTGSSCVAAGPSAAIGELTRNLIAAGIAVREVHSAHAFHSTLLEPIKPALADLMSSIELRPPTIAMVSNVTGDWLTAADATDPNYWVRHACQCVRFSEGLATLREKDRYAYFEVGPGRGLSAFLLQDTSPEDRGGLCVAQCLAGAQDNVSDSYLLARALAAGWCSGVEVDWSAHRGKAPLRRISLPTYAFDRQRYWIDPPTAAAPTANSAATREAPAPLGEGEPAPSQQQPAAAARVDVPVPPEGDVEELMARLWARVLGTDAIGRDDNFFHLGGSSLLAVQLRSHLRDALAVEMPLRVLFDHPTLQGVSAHIEHLLLSELEEEGREEEEAPGPAGAATEAFWGEPTPIQLPNGVEIVQFNPSETQHFYHDIFETEVYARNGIALRPDAVVFDVGANIGLFSLFVTGKARDATIYAFEPAPPLFAALRRNTEPHASAMRLFNAGVAATASRQSLTFYPYSTGMSTFHADLAEEQEVLRAIVTNQHQDRHEGSEAILENLEDILESRFTSHTFECEIVTLSQIIDSHSVDRIDLLKIDVQKSELAVLQGIEARHWPLIGQIVIEVHDIGGRVEQTRRLLEERGFAVRVEQDPLYRDSAIFNLYALRDSGSAALPAASGEQSAEFDACETGR